MMAPLKQWEYGSGVCRITMAIGYAKFVWNFCIAVSTATVGDGGVWKMFEIKHASLC